MNTLGAPSFTIGGLVGGAALPQTEDVDVLLAALGCTSVERRRRSTYGRAFAPCVRCKREHGWGSTGFARSTFTEVGWFDEPRYLIRWFMQTRVPWLAFVNGYGRDDEFFVPAWAKQIRVATDLLSWAKLTAGSAGWSKDPSDAPPFGSRRHARLNKYAAKPKVKTDLRVDAVALMNYALDTPDFRGIFQGLVSMLPASGVTVGGQALNDWLRYAKVPERARASVALYEWLVANAPSDLIVDARERRPDPREFDEG